MSLEEATGIAGNNDHPVTNKKRDRDDNRDAETRKKS
jgi:hypothetical protein